MTGSINSIASDEGVASTTLVRFVKGTTAGLVAAACLQPLQVVKTSMQITPIERKQPPVDGKVTRH